MDIHITYEALFDLLRKERSLNELQHLDPDFWIHVLTYITTRETEAKLKLGLSDSEKMRLQIINVKKIIQEIYERREKKIVNLALNVIRTDASGFVDTQNMLADEKIIFNEFVGLLKSYHKCVLENIFSGNAPDITKLNSTKTKIAKTLNLQIETPVYKQNAIDAIQEAKKIVQQDEDDNIRAPQTNEESFDGEQEVDNEQTPATDGRMKIKFLMSVPKFMGKNKDIFGPFNENEEAELPEKIALILIKKGKVTKI